MSGFSEIDLDPEVSQGVLRGDHQAVSAAYRQMAQAVINLATRILQDRHLAEEVVQDTFIELVEKAPQIKDPKAIPAWVRRVAVNHCLMRLRQPWHSRREPEVDLETLEQQHSSSAHAAERMHHAASLDGALARLAPQARTVVWLHDVEGYTHKEIGELMGKTTSYSKSQLARAYEKLLGYLQVNPTADGSAQQRELV